MDLKDNYQYRSITTATTTNVDAGQGQLVRIVLTTTAAGAITIYDEASGGTTDIIASFTSSAALGTYDFGVQYKKGIQIVTAAASALTVVFNPIG